MRPIFFLYMHINQLRSFVWNYKVFFMGNRNLIHEVMRVSMGKRNFSLVLWRQREIRLSEDCLKIVYLNNFKLLLIVNSAANSIAYAFFKADIRRELRHLFLCQKVNLVFALYMTRTFVYIPHYSEIIWFPRTHLFDKPQTLAITLFPVYS